ncbi:hypothetical protein FNJ21_004277, partial [Vibrio fluvialis]|nr:hypothetical protein [Vibrio fluvialis]
KIIFTSIEHLKRKSILDIDAIAFASNHNFDSDLQAKAHLFARDKNNTLKSFSKEDVSKYITIINEIYTIRKTKESLQQLINVVYSWLMGSPLSAIISNSIKYGKTVRDPQAYGWVDFNPNDPMHLNQKIIETINCIESEVTFLLESCCSHFYQLSKSIHGESQAGRNLAPALEYGTMDSREAELQDYGFSRLAASEIVKRYKDCVTFSSEKNRLKVNIRKLATVTGERSLIRKELTWLSK